MNAFISPARLINSACSPWGNYSFRLVLSVKIILLNECEGWFNSDHSDSSFSIVYSKTCYCEFDQQRMVKMKKEIMIITCKLPALKDVEFNKYFYFHIPCLRFYRLIKLNNLNHFRPVFLNFSLSYESFWDYDDSCGFSSQKNILAHKSLYSDLRQSHS